MFFVQFDLLQRGVIPINVDHTIIAGGADRSFLDDDDIPEMELEEIDKELGGDDDMSDELEDEEEAEEE